MLKLNEEIIDEVCAEIIKRDDDQHTSRCVERVGFDTPCTSLLNFMMSGREPFAAAIKWFSTLEMKKVQIKSNLWKLNHEIDKIVVPERNDWTFDNFPFIKPISLAIVENFQCVELENPTPSSFAFLQQLKSLKRLKIVVSSRDEFKELLPHLDALEFVERLELSIPNGTFELLDLLKFKFEFLSCKMFEFEAKPVCKLRPDTIGMVFCDDEKVPKQRFIFEPHHFINYANLFPNAPDFVFTVVHTLTDRDTDVYKFCKPENAEFAKEIKENIRCLERMDITIRYFNMAPIMTSKMFKDIKAFTINSNGVYECPRAYQYLNGVSIFYWFDFPQRFEYVASRWRKGVLYTKTIPPECKNLFKPEDVVIVRVVDQYGNAVFFKFPLDMPMELLKNFFGKHCGVDPLYLRVIYEGLQIEDHYTFRNLKRLRPLASNLIHVVCSMY